MNCDLCLLNFPHLEIEDTHEHAMIHCDDGEHCTSSDAGCAASKGVDDHSSICCVCGVELG